MRTKMYFLFTLFTVTLLAFGYTVKANTVTFPAFPEPVEGKSSTHYLICYRSDGAYFLLKPLNPLNKGVYVAQEGNKAVFKFNTFAISYSWNPEEGGSSWEKWSEHDYLTSLDCNIQFLYSSFDVYYSDGTIFFQRAPIKVSFLTQIKKVRMGAVMETVAKMVPVVMIAVVGFLGFRKAFNLLLKVFHQA